jgi:hypothetical protein
LRKLRAFLLRLIGLIAIRCGHDEFAAEPESPSAHGPRFDPSASLRAPEQADGGTTSSVFGLLWFCVATRVSEIGTRMALGATRGQVQTLFPAETLAILLIGLVPPRLLLLIMVSVAHKPLYGDATLHSRAVALSGGVLLAAGRVAPFIPAHRAASINPMLRCAAHSARDGQPAPDKMPAPRPALQELGRARLRLINPLR